MRLHHVSPDHFTDVPGLIEGHGPVDRHEYVQPRLA
jgi:hypothetical protein